MSLQALNRQLEVLAEDTIERIIDKVETMGLDPDADEVLESIASWFGGQMRDNYEEQIA